MQRYWNITLQIWTESKFKNWLSQLQLVSKVNWLICYEFYSFLIKNALLPFIAFFITSKERWAHQKEEKNEHTKLYLVCYCRYSPKFLRPFTVRIHSWSYAVCLVLEDMCSCQSFGQACFWSIQLPKRKNAVWFLKRFLKLMTCLTCFMLWN